MGKRLLIAVVVLLLGLATLVLWKVLPSQEPVYQGKRLSAWLESLDNPPGNARWKGAGWYTHWSEGNGRTVEAALRYMGPDAVPALRRMVRCRDHPLALRSRLMLFARRLRLINYRIDDEWAFHYRAAAACRLAGPEIRTPLLADWIGLLTETKAQSAQYEDACFCFTMAAIGNLSPSACEPLIEALTNTSTQLRIYAATVLFQFRSSQSEIVLPALLDRLRKDPDSSVQFNAVSTLCLMPTTVVPVLLRELKGSYASARRGSLVSLGSFTNQASIIVPAALTELADEDVEVRRAATNALTALGWTGHRTNGLSQ